VVLFFLQARRTHGRDRCVTSKMVVQRNIRDRLIGRRNFVFEDDYDAQTNVI